MKELTIEQKAKAYDEALKVLHKYDGANIMFTQDLKEEMFPELKEEDGDEKIRKAIIEHFAGSHSSMYPYKGFTKEQIITWLEKQDEQKPIEWSEKDKYKVKDIIYFLNSAKKHYASTDELDACVRWLWSILQRMG